MFICLKKITFFSSQTTNNWRFLRIFVIEKTKCYIYEEEISSKHYRRRDDVSFLTPNFIIGTTLFLPIFRLKLFFNGYLQKDSYSFFIRMIIRFKLSETSLADSGFQIAQCPQTFSVSPSGHKAHHPNRSKELRDVSVPMC